MSQLSWLVPFLSGFAIGLLTVVAYGFSLVYRLDRSAKRRLKA